MTHTLNESHILYIPVYVCVCGVCVCVYMCLSVLGYSPVTRSSAQGNERFDSISVKKSVEQPNGYQLLWNKQHLLRRKYTILQHAARTTNVNMNSN